MVHVEKERESVSDKGGGGEDGGHALLCYPNVNYSPVICVVCVQCNGNYFKAHRWHFMYIHGSNHSITIAPNINACIICTAYITNVGNRTNICYRMVSQLAST